MMRHPLVGFLVLWVVSTLVGVWLLGSCHVLANDEFHASPASPSPGPQGGRMTTTPPVFTQGGRTPELYFPWRDPAVLQQELDAQRQQLMMCRNNLPHDERYGASVLLSMSQVEQLKAQTGTYPFHVCDYCGSEYPNPQTFRCYPKKQFEGLIAQNTGQYTPPFQLGASTTDTADSPGSSGYYQGGTSYQDTPGGYGTGTGGYQTGYGNGTATYDYPVTHSPYQAKVQQNSRPSGPAKPKVLDPLYKASAMVGDFPVRFKYRRSQVQGQTNFNINLVDETQYRPGQVRVPPKYQLANVDITPQGVFLKGLNTTADANNNSGWYMLPAPIQMQVVPVK